jgi:hypothetical protein
MQEINRPVVDMVNKGDILPGRLWKVKKLSGDPVVEADVKELYPVFDDVCRQHQAIAGVSEVIWHGDDGEQGGTSLVASDVNLLKYYCIH